MIEWLETNNCGGFCCSTTMERNTRKYHGLLVSPVNGHEGRFHILSAVDAELRDGSGLTLGTNSYPDAEYPESSKYIESYDLMPFPAWLYSHGGSSVRKEIFMRSGEKAVWIAYTLEEGPDEAELGLKFLFTFRGSHSLTRANDALNGEIIKMQEGISLTPYEELPSVEIAFSDNYAADGELYWDYNICYEKEKERGLEWVEDRFVPGNISVKLLKKRPFVIRLGLKESEPVNYFSSNLLEIYNDEISARKTNAEMPCLPLDVLKYQSRHFLLKNPSGKQSINAGYPWFGEWGRDTMIALPGLTFYSGRTETGIQILLDYTSMIKDGLLPNTLGDTQGYTSYNSIDAGLLFCWAVSKMLDSGFGQKAQEVKILSDKLLPAVESVINAFIENRVPNAELTDEGLLRSGSKDTQLTWMDATAWGRPVTPRYGFAVELNSLWYDALKLNKRLCEICKRDFDKNLGRRAAEFPALFRGTFWLDDLGYLSDTVNENGPDRKIRPNMLFASSASDGLLDEHQISMVVQTAMEHLLTPLGLRTLAPDDPDFCPVYSGGSDQRDSTYHQGTVWPWPLGIMIESSLKAAEDIEKKVVFWSDYIDNLLNKHLFNDGWGFISEIFDGLNPDKGKGAFAQAWSCSEILRAAHLIKEIR